MFTRILSPLSAEPNLALTRAHVRRTPLARLGIVYQIWPQPPCRGPSPAAACACAEARHVPESRPGEYFAFLGQSWSHAQLQLTRNLGEALYLDSIIMGGINGETLPVTLDRCQAAWLAAHASGSELDVVA